jgi:hypothetical protein
MTMSQRSARVDVDDHDLPSMAGRTRSARRPAMTGTGAEAANDERATSTSRPRAGDVGSLTLSELVAAAEERRMDPSSLLADPTQAEARDALEFAAQLPEPVAALAVSVARLDPAAAAVVAGMIERYAAAVRRHRPPAR